MSIHNVPDGWLCLRSHDRSHVVYLDPRHVIGVQVCNTEPVVSDRAHVWLTAGDVFEINSDDVPQVVQAIDRINSQAAVHAAIRSRRYPPPDHIGASTT